MTHSPLAILFDLDGTLVDASDPIADGILQLARDRGLAVPTREWALARIGFSPAETWRELGADDPAALVTLFRERFLEDLPARTRLLPGMRETLAGLHGHGYRLALATTRGNASAIATLAHAGVLELMECIGGGDDVARHKPAPDVIRFVLERLRCEPGDALMVGDTAADVEAAHAAGVTCWSVLGGTHDEATLRAAGTDSILSGIAALPAALGLPAPASALPPARPGAAP